MSNAPDTPGATDAAKPPAVPGDARLPLLDEFDARGIVDAITDAPELAARLARGPITLYCGFDPTADSLHIGSLLPLVTMRRFQVRGHRPIALVGGATGMIGDPSGKSEERRLLDAETLAGNLAGMRAQIERFLDFEGPAAARIVDNAEWLVEFNLVRFLREVGKHFSVNAMIKRESVRARLEREGEGLSFTEFAYMLLQAEDFRQLFVQAGCELQIGGSDQFGNIVSGIELIRRTGAMAGAVPAGRPASRRAFGLTFPLIAKADGTKFGKTEAGNVWLDPERSSPFRFYQFWMATDDRDVERFLKFFSARPLAELDELARAHAVAPEKREAPRALAAEMTELVHGAAGLARAERATAILFGGDIGDASGEDLEEIFGDVPSVTVTHEALAAGISLVAALAELGLAPSKKEARRRIEAGAVTVNNRRVGTDPAQTLGPAAIVGGRFIVVRVGKRDNRGLLKVAN